MYSDNPDVDAVLPSLEIKIFNRGRARCDHTAGYRFLSWFDTR